MAAVNEIAVSTRKVVLMELGIVLMPLESQRPALRAGRKSNNVVTFADCRGARDQSLFRDASAHQRHEPTAAGDFEFAEDRVKMLFHRRQTQAGAIGDLLVTAPFTDKSRKFLFSACKPDEMRQTGAGRPGTPSNLTAQIFALDKKMRLRHAA